MSQWNEETLSSNGRSTPSSTQAAASSIPIAPYPPLNYRASPQKSSLSSTPHYSTGYGGGSAPSHIASNTGGGGLVGDNKMAASSSDVSMTSAFTATSEADYNSMRMSSRQFYKAGSNVSSGTNSSMTPPGGSVNSINKTSDLGGPSTHPSRITFCPGWHDVVASINCVSESTTRTKSFSRPPSRTMSSGSNLVGNPMTFMPPDAAVTNAEGNTTQTMARRKVGPVMLELRRVELARNVISRGSSGGRLKLPSSLRNMSDYVNEEEKDDNFWRLDDDNEGRKCFFTTRTIGVSRGNPSLGPSVASTCLAISPVLSYDTISAATGSSTGALCIHRFELDDLNEMDISNTDLNAYATGLTFSSAPIEYFHNSRHHRQASAVAWRPVQTNHVAVGLVGSTATGSITHPSHNIHHRRTTPSLRTGGDREFCCFLWDISDSKKTTTPIQKFCHNSPVASLAWMMDGQTLVVGGTQRTIHLCDMRAAAGTNVPPLSAHVHESGVHGIEVDPHRPYLMATFSRALGEPVKLFDIRRMEKAVSEIKITNSVYHETSSLSSPAQHRKQAHAEAIQWSYLEPGILTIATGDSVQHYDTSSGSRPTLVNVNFTRNGTIVKNVALYQGKSKESLDILKSRSGAQSTREEEEELFQTTSERLLSLLYPRRMLTVLGDQTIHDMPIDTSAPLAISRRDGRLVHVLGPCLWIGSPTEGPTAMERTSISLQDDDISAIMMRRAKFVKAAAYSMNPEANTKLMSRELGMKHGSTHVESSDAMNHENLGLLRLWSWIDRVESLCFQDVDDVDEYPIWTAKSLLDAGSWHLLELDSSSKDDIETAGEDGVAQSDTLGCDVYDSPARRAALAALGWAGRFDLTIVMADCEALGEFERSAALAVWHENVGEAVVALQPRVSSCSFACHRGYGSKTGAQLAVWRKACLSLLQRQDLSPERAKHSRVAYLRGMCEFLLNVGTGDSLNEVLDNQYVSLCDRVAFACRFLGEAKLRSFLRKSIDKCQRHGDIEGLVITGVNKEGIKILQSFVDIYTDIQTTALVVSRVVLPSDWTFERRICFEWVESYRSLLNHWQMWQSRAMFDVDRADVLRSVKARIGGSGNQRRAPSMQRGRQSQRQPDPDVLPSIPAQMEVRCNYCSSPLSLKRNEGLTNQWLSKMQPMLNCCAQCRKPLPRCSICLLSLGGLNPYVELTRQRQGSRGSTGADDLSSLSSMSFAEWYTWCMRCGHGGHAHHMLGWFSNQKSCPVSGCNCECEFGGVQKSNRSNMEAGTIDPN